MPEVLRLLQKEHADFSRLLDLLDRQLAVFASGERPDYDVIGAVIDYCLDYPDAMHHPKEDLIYRVLESRNAELARIVGDLEEDHRRIAAMTRELAEALRQVLAEELVDRQRVHDLTESFIRGYRRHIALEEEKVFPAAERTLSRDDWDSIDARLERRGDPLFGDAVVDRFRALRDDIDGLASIAEGS
jgi:hemerythrin-like domain-containing protein